MSDRASRQELLRTIETQKEKIAKYESKLKDVIVAYKGILKEKEALEASVKILSQSKTEKVKPSSNDESKKSEEDSESSKEEEAFYDPLQSTKQVPSTEENTGSDTKSSEIDQIHTLTESLYTLTQEKSKLESVYLTDKKRLLQENEDLNSRLTEQRDKFTQQIKMLESQIQELKTRVRGQQNEREKEQNDHALMLRELQKLLAEERTSKEQLENQLDDIKTALSEKSQLLPNMSQAYEKRIADMSSELQDTKNQLATEKVKSQEPPAAFIELQKETARMKEEYQHQMQQEQKKNNEADVKLEKCRQQSEERVSALESKISELSEMVGNYERFKVQDHQTIHKLKERVSQLDIENTALSRSADEKVRSGEEEWENMNPSQLGEKIVQLVEHLKMANQRSESQVHVDDLLRDEDGQCPLCRKHREELENLREEYERYKLRAQSVLKNKSSKDSGTNKEIDALKTQVSELREKIKSLHLQHDSQVEKEKQKIDTAHKTLLSVQDKHKAEILHMEAEFQHQKSELEMEIRKQRDRSVSLLAEKDREIETLRTSAPLYDDPYFVQLQNPPDAGASAEIPRGKSEEEQAVSRLLNMSSLGQGDTNLLFFRQELSRKEVEINSLRKQKHDFEGALRDLQFTSCSKEEALREKLENMSEEVKRGKRNKAREGANLEYLKNVTYKFLTSFDPKAKQQMLNAITTILQFSPQEKSVVHTQLKSWWSGTL